MKFHDRLAEARKYLGFSQTEIAERVGITTQTQLKYEKGKNSPTVEYLMQIQELGFDISELLGLEVTKRTEEKDYSKIAITAFNEVDIKCRAETGELFDFGIRLKMFRELISKLF